MQAFLGLAVVGLEMRIPMPAMYESLPGEDFPGRPDVPESGPENWVIPR
jgi:hypothetical protein